MRYTGDDYCYGGLFRQRGFWETVRSTYLGPSPFHGNRYSLTLTSGMAEFGGAAANAALPALVLGVWLVALIQLIRRAARSSRFGDDSLAVLLAAECVVFFSLAISPELGQSLYWRSGMLPYLAPLVLMSSLGFLLLVQAGPGGGSRFGWVLLLGLALLGAGLSETAAALQVGALGLFMVGALVFPVFRESRFRRGLHSIGAALAGTVVAGALQMLSPATSLRLAGLKVTSDLGALASQTVRHSYIYLHGLPFYYPLPCAAVFIAFFCLTLLQEPDGTDSGGAIRAGLLIRGLLVAFAWFVLVMSVMLPSAYAQSSYPVGRALVGAAFISVLGIAALGMLAGRFASSVGLKAARLRAPIVALLLASVMLYPLAEARAAFLELPRYRRWSQFWDARDRQIRQARSRGILELEVVFIDTIIPGVAELQHNPDFWYNNCAEWLYDMRRLSANQPGWDD